MKFKQRYYIYMVVLNHFSKQNECFSYICLKSFAVKTLHDTPFAVSCNQRM